jgi:hypothetical protein
MTTAADTPFHNEELHQILMGYMKKQSCMCGIQYTWGTWNVYTEPESEREELMGQNKYSLLPQPNYFF